jgi:hypothetical protein
LEASHGRLLTADSLRREWLFAPLPSKPAGFWEILAIAGMRCAVIIGSSAGSTIAITRVRTGAGVMAAVTRTPKPTVGVAKLIPQAADRHRELRRQDQPTKPVAATPDRAMSAEAVGLSSAVVAV